MCEDSNDSKLQLGTEVKIIGPSRGGDSRHTGEKIEISQIDISKSHGEFYSHEGFSWYPASSLQVVQKFKIGDWVEVIGECFTGDVFQIDETNESALGKLFSAKGRCWFSPKSLRKLTPEEVIYYAGPSELSADEKVSIGKLIHEVICRDDIEDQISHDKWRNKISETENRQEAQRKWLSQLEIRQNNHGKRLADVEYILSEIKKRLELIK